MIHMQIKISLNSLLYDASPWLRHKKGRMKSPTIKLTLEFSGGASLANDKKTPNCNRMKLIVLDPRASPPQLACTSEHASIQHSPPSLSPSPGLSITGTEMGLTQVSQGTASPPFWADIGGLC